MQDTACEVESVHKCRNSRIKISSHLNLLLPRVLNSKSLQWFFWRWQMELDYEG